jgi:adenylate kinase
VILNQDRPLSRGTSGIRITRLVLLGAPGAGKGTQARRLSERLAVPHVSSGELLRRAVEAGSPLGMTAGRFIDRGGLVPDEVAIQIVLARISQQDAEHGFILDGFPRTLRQAEAVDAELGAEGRALERVVELRVPEGQRLDRIAGRAQFSHRSDDRQDAVANRLRVYLAQTAPLVDYYRTRGLLVTVDGVGTVEEVGHRIERALKT